MTVSQMSIPGVYRDDQIPRATPSLTTGVPVFIGLGQLKPLPEESSIPWRKLRQLETLATVWRPANNSNLAESYLPEAVRGFFANGGKVCYVMALANLDITTLVQALSQLQDLDDIDLVCAPDLVITDRADRSILSNEALIQRQQKLLEHCDRMGDRFALLDAGQHQSDLRRQRQQLHSRNGALYFPWIEVSTGQAHARLVPPCGHLAGIYAQMDRQVGVHHAPANQVIEGAVGLGASLSTAQQRDLYNQQPEQGAVNLIRALPGRGIRAWGAYTLSRDRKWRYINVRRLVLTVNRWIELNLSQVAFEPNTPQLWSAIKRDLGEYLGQLFQAGALQGASPEEAFYVKCDAETNPETVRSQGRVVTEIGLAPLEPGEFIRVTWVQSLGGGNEAAAP
jgi:hypothetical protein